MKGSADINGCAALEGFPLCWGRGGEQAGLSRR